MSKPKSLPLPSPALVLACLALFAAVGGVAFAAHRLKKDSVGAKQIKANAVRGSEIQDGAVTGDDVADGSIGAGDLAEGAIPDAPAGPAGFGVTRAESVMLDASTSVGTPIATLSDLPAGAYAITAKTIAKTNTANTVNCSLSAPAAGGGDVDFSSGIVSGGSNFQTIPMQLLHQFPQDGGQVRVACSLNTIGGGGTGSVSQTRIQAIRLGSTSEKAVTG